jgi:L-ascorbate metabolism protein UlaG (beta-lactamase superfamily)
LKINRKKFLISIFASIGALIASGWALFKLPQFGGKATGQRLDRILSSPNYRRGRFQNLTYTPDLSGGATYWDILKEFRKNHPNKIPKTKVPVQKTNLKDLKLSQNQLIWFGHSSYMIVLDGLKILVDPVFSEYASPFNFGVKAFEGTSIYTATDLPDIDVLVLTHDHYDHADYKLLKQIKPLVKSVVTSLGVGAHLEAWHYPAAIIYELDWHENINLGPLTFTALPARHFSGRTMKRQQSLWSSFVLKSPSQNIYIGGDSGYESHFALIGQQYGPFDLALLDGAQYHAYWKHIHMLPEEAVQAALDLQAAKVVPVHWGKFPLAHHPWFEPIERFVAAANSHNLNFISQKIGTIIYWQQPNKPDFWWREII